MDSILNRKTIPKLLRCVKDSDNGREFCASQLQCGMLYVQDLKIHKPFSRLCNSHMGNNEFPSGNKNCLSRHKSEFLSGNKVFPSGTNESPLGNKILSFETQIIILIGNEVFPLGNDTISWRDHWK